MFLCYLILCYVVLCYVVLCYVVLRYVVLRYVVLCYVVLAYFFNLRTLFPIKTVRNLNFCAILAFTAPKLVRSLIFCA